ncbi:iron-containing alcohol dehydrogenase [Sedimentisphaera salicampi]|uniref:Alcohol dehydrogenase 2 n=1 Tax=Sedimentisphaera salicampi TaxID=1941349 RepID=A0A1W6LLQ3_9BACT|nr:iron-containing alcohol dehydrogenase [Sedimentisphaera salicampi]ARN56730.1 Alcohol dehydrogenase 2 [Sedimentisphaera salicampi]OXU15171.1 Alcohol dehydrogenase 2 [Sedimentisphaera salicampi]
MDSSIERIVQTAHPQTLVFGSGCASQLADMLSSRGCTGILLVTAKAIRPMVESIAASVKQAGISVLIDDSVNTEPTIDMFERLLEDVTDHIDAVIGIGGGSVLDAAKLAAAVPGSGQQIDELFGTGKIRSRKKMLICLPTTAGTGSEVSPNAILLDEKADLKKGVISPYLVPDAVYVDPELTRSIPPEITAATGMDALSHCVEAYANLHAHQFVDTYAIRGIELIGKNIETAFSNGEDMDARSALSLGSMYGGYCLGPVNTAAVHALSYPLGGKFHIAHGAANAILLPEVMQFNLTAAPKRYAEIAVALGCPAQSSDMETGLLGIERVREICRRCKIPDSLSQYGIAKSDVPAMAKSAMSVTRLLKNNVRELTQEDAEKIYQHLLKY